jgi:Na+/H+ antiporter
MQTLEQLLGLFVIAVLLSAAARRVGAPYPVFLAVGGALIALLPGGPVFTLPPELVLALFVAPVLLDSAYDMSLRDLRDNWAPVAGLAVCAVGLTTAAVAMVAHALAPALPWAAAVTLGAIVAPPDAVAAGAVLRQLHPPQRILTVLEGESLLNDATALLIYRLAVGSVAVHGFSWDVVGPTFLLAVAGSLVAGLVVGRLVLYVIGRVEHIPTTIILQFVFTFGVWVLAEAAGLSAVLTMVCYAVTIKRSRCRGPGARVRIATDAVWSAAVFALNIMAFIFIGLQMRPILESLARDELTRYIVVTAAVLATVIVVRLAWHMPFNAILRWRDRRFGFQPPRPMLRPTVGSGLVISWAGMRGIVTLAAAMALPQDFPQRDLVVFVAFGVSLGTLVINGLTLKPLLRALRLHDDDPVGREVGVGRERAYRAGLASMNGEQSPEAEYVRQKFTALLASQQDPGGETGLAAVRQQALSRRVLRAARQSIYAMRADDEIGDDAFRSVEQELDWLEMALGEEVRSG